MGWLQKEPLPGVFQISIDRPGYGESQSDDHTLRQYLRRRVPTFEMIVKDSYLPPRRRRGHSSDASLEK